MPDLRSALEDLASRFADEVLAAIRSASLDELVADVRRTPSAQTAPRVARPVGRPRGVVRSNGPAAPKLGPEQVAQMLDKVLALVKTSAGLKNDEIRQRLGFTPEQMRPVIQRGVAEGKIKRRGHARSTTYTVS